MQIAINNNLHSVWHNKNAQHSIPLQCGFISSFCVIKQACCKRFQFGGITW